ncbi:MAG: nucleoside hydrolase [bacterium]
MRYLFLGILTLTLPYQAAAAETPAPIPCILDTDIGGDIDDTWALSLILASPELDLKLVVTDSHDTVGRAKIVAKFLESVGRSDIPVGYGNKFDEHPGPQGKWAENYNLKSYPGGIHPDGVQAMIDVIQSAGRPVYLFVIGPCPNIPELLKRAPDVVKKVKVFAMSGSVRLGYDGRPTPDAEYNVRDNVPASQALYQADWDLTIAPLDTAGLVYLAGDRYQALQQADNPLVQTLLANYRVWAKEGRHSIDPESRSSTLFDPVAVYLAIDPSLCVMEDVRLKVDEKGFTVKDASARIIHAAMSWKDKEKFEDWLLERLKSGVVMREKK